MSKSTGLFKNRIKRELDQRASDNPLFKEKYDNPEKNLDDCIQYIFSEVKNSGCNGFEDEEIFSMAIHYYSEADIKASGKKLSPTVVINEEVKLTAEEIATAKQQAKDKVIAEEMNRIRNVGKVNKKPNDKSKKPDEPLSLF
tara:strand:+ start:14874 stop:15299 length:426 start_codon:yes stop_codon:yes gene_type:complete